MSITKSVFCAVAVVSSMSLSVAATAADDSVTDQCQKWASSDASIKAYEVKDYIKACVAAKSQDDGANRNVKFTWNRSGKSGR